MPHLSYRSCFSLVTGLGLLIAARPAMASDPLSTYVVPAAVELLPGDTNGTRVVIHGAFFQLTTTVGMTYTDPKCGVMYFDCVAGQETMCRMQWTELRNAISAAPQFCEGFGSANTLSTASIRTEGATLGAPDRWDLGMGVSQGVFVDGKCPVARALVCPLASPPDGGIATDARPNPTDAPASNDAPASTDAPAIETAAPTPEAGTSTDAPASGTDAQAADHPTTTIPDAGATTDGPKLAPKSGGCTVAGSSTDSAPLASMLAGLLVLGLTRASRRRR
jgi:hypothetical protein